MLFLIFIAFLVGGGSLVEVLPITISASDSKHAHSGILRQHSSLNAWLQLSTPRAAVFHLAASSVTNLKPAVQCTD